MPTKQQLQNQLNYEKKKAKRGWAAFFRAQWELTQQQQTTYIYIRECVDTTPSEHLKVGFLKMAEELKKKFTCCICMDDIPVMTDENTKDITITKCGHIYHTGCVNKWLENKDTCPTCRTKIKY
jgi:hypothetical protein